MKLRLLPLVVTTALGASTLLIADPASAVLAPPAISALDATTAGKVTGMVTSDQPYVFVALVDGPLEPTRTKVTMAESSAFDLATWGYGPGTSFAAWACPTDTFVAADCSVATTTEFTPTDVVPDVTWFEDATLGPEDPDPVITVSDPGGGGVLRATQVGYSDVLASTVVEPGEPTAIDVVHQPGGLIRLTRCSAGDFKHCSGFSPDQQMPLHVVHGFDVVVPEPVVPASPTAEGTFRLQLTLPGWNLAGSATVTWHLEDLAAPGIPVGSEHTSTVATETNGNLPKIGIPHVDIPDGTYVVVGDIDLQTAEFGLISDQPFTTSSFAVDTVAPILKIAANHPTIYPNVNTTKRPGKVSWTITGTEHQNIGRAEIHRSGGSKVRTGIVSTGWDRSVVQWDGKGTTGRVVTSGYYKLMLWDKSGNPIAAKGVVRVDARRVVTREWRKTVTAGGSLVDQYVGRCSTLRKPSSRGWSYSLGYYANTKCADESTKASLVSTVHAIYVPKASDGYVSVKVSAYGGSATSRPGSRGVLRYLTASGNWTSENVVQSFLGWHPGYQRAATGMIYRGRSFAWGFYTGFGHRYDVKTFAVVVRYRTLG